MDDIPALHRAIPPDHHPATLIHKGVDDLPTRAGVTGMTQLYNTWAKLADLESQLSDKSKLKDIAIKDMSNALTKADAVIRHLKDVEGKLNTSIKNAIISKRTRYDAELRAHYKGKPSEAMKAIQDPEIAAALYDVPNVLLGFTQEQVDLLRDQIERTHVPSDHSSRASARRATKKLEAAHERFGSTYLAKIAAWANSDDALIARAGAA